MAGIKGFKTTGLEIIEREMVRLDLASQDGSFTTTHCDILVQLINAYVKLFGSDGKAMKRKNMTYANASDSSLVEKLRRNRDKVDRLVKSGHKPEV